MHALNIKTLKLCIKKNIIKNSILVNVIIEHL